MIYFQSAKAVPTRILPDQQGPGGSVVLHFPTAEEAQSAAATRTAELGGHVVHLAWGGAPPFRGGGSVAVCLWSEGPE